MKNTDQRTKLSPFLHAYITTALWSSTEYQFGECPCCGETRLLSHYPEPEFDQIPMCSGPDCGVREIPNSPPMDDNYSLTDLAPETLRRMSADCDAFLAKATPTIESAETGQDKWSQAAHDFWLTRNGHGAGFWDGDWPEPMATQLDEMAKSFGECSLYAGDDGKIYIH